ncbi:LPS assembly lipoprotein LptE [Burkholderia ubonensis]|uniref:LPS-assembly lipoprotein LptE n=1 Tax=Burkholderia ubonensis TaxID=101571 RepID=UPI001E4A418B|nr:LPS assembly lipoprotein LptE [Burkholderia ubonensis]
MEVGALGEREGFGIQTINVRRRVLLWAALCTIGMTGCGFRLRGWQGYAFSRVYIDGAQDNVRARLTRLIEGGSDATVVPSPVEAEVLLIISEKRHQKTLTIDRENKVNSFEINYSMTYSLLRKRDGGRLIEPGEISLGRAMTYNTKAAQAKSTEIDILYLDMQNDACDQLIRRLAALRTLYPEPDEVLPSIVPRTRVPPM